jgi:hypothetical protein
VRVISLGVLSVLLALVAGATLVTAWPIVLIGALVVVLSKVTAKSVATVIPLMILLPVSVASGRDLSGYRTFSFGASIADISKQIDHRSSDPHNGPRTSRTDSAIDLVTVFEPRLCAKSRTIERVRFWFYERPHGSWSARG